MSTALPELSAEVIHQADQNIINILSNAKRQFEIPPREMMVTPDDVDAILSESNSESNSEGVA